MRQMTLPSTIVAIFASTCFAFAAEPGDNLIVNADLSEVTDDGLPAGWERHDNFTSVAVDAEEHPEGHDRSIRVAIQQADEGLHSQLAHILDDIKPNTPYVLTGWLKGEVNAAGYLQVKLYSTVDGRRGELRRITAGEATADWQQVRAEFDSGEADSLTVLARVNGAAAGADTNFWFAGITLREKVTHAIDLRGLGGESDDLIPQMIEYLPEEAREGRFEIGAEDGAPILGITNFIEGPTLVLSQAFDVTPGMAHRMTLQTRGWGQFRVEWFTQNNLRRHRGEELQPLTMNFLTRPDDEWRSYECLVPDMGTERIWLNISIEYSNVWGQCWFRDLRMTPIEPPVADRPLELTPGQTLSVEHLAPIDCRGLRGFMAAPIDGTMSSRHYGYGICEYGDLYAGQAVFYHYNAFDGLHVDFAEPVAFNYVAMRGGAYARMYRDAESFDRPGDAPVLYEFTQQPTLSAGDLRQPRINTSFPLSAQFEQAVTTDNVSFFDVMGGSISDIGFYRVREIAAPEGGEPWALTAQTVSLPEPESPYDVRNHQAALVQRENGQSQRLLAMQRGAAPAELSLAAGERTRFFATPAEERFGLDALTLELEVSAPATPFRLMALVHDPIDPRRDLQCVATRIPGPGTYRLYLDFEDQIVEPERRVWLTLESDTDCALSGATVRLHEVPAEAALEEALAWRKLIMKAIFVRISEPRSWMRWKDGLTRTEVLEYYGPEQGRYLAELFATIDDCHRWAPEDDEVRQYREWCYAGALEELSTPPAPPAPDPDVPAWAHYSRIGWLQMRDIAQRWFDQRIVKTGEFGGRVNDDTCFFQQLTDFPKLQQDGLTPTMLDGATRLNDFMHRQSVLRGVNRNDMDPLHAYEEGMNHLTLMADWFYGDPIYVENLMESTRSLEVLTVKTEDGRRHFRRSKQGAGDAINPRPLDLDEGWRALTMHPAAELAHYNRSPRAMTLLTEWADTWVSYQRPGAYASAIDVATGEVVRADEHDPLSGYTQKDLHVWLADMTGDERFVKPLKDLLREDPVDRHVIGRAVNLYNSGLLDDFDAGRLQELGEQSVFLGVYLSGDPSPFADLILGTPEAAVGRYLSTIYSVQRWPEMMDPGKQYTDRVWFSMMGRVARTYLGGQTKRNEVYPEHAVTWEGLGDDYAAAVVSNRKDHLKVFVYNFRREPMSGLMRVWRLDHGRYEVTLGPDADEDNIMDAAASTRTLELAKADAVPLELAPRSVTVIEARQVEELPSIFTRPDLAIAAREVTVGDGQVEVILHNIGGAEATNVRVALVSESGERIAETTVASIAAPLDLEPKRIPVTVEIARPVAPGWLVIVDPDNAIEEIYEGNNEALCPAAH